MCKNNQTPQLRKGLSRWHDMATQLMRFISSTIWLMAGSMAILIGAVAGITWYLNKNNDIGVSDNSEELITPTQIRSIESIGQWEFLAVSDEEMVDTVRHGFFGDDELIRIYYGTVRLGIDMSKLEKDWIHREGDSLVCKLPASNILDDKFIDEARTRSVYEEGEWSAKDREDMYQRAHEAMKRRALTDTNRSKAWDNANLQVKQLFNAMGIKRIRIDIGVCQPRYPDHVVKVK